MSIIWISICVSSHSNGQLSHKLSIWLENRRNCNRLAGVGFQHWPNLIFCVPHFVFRFRNFLYRYALDIRWVSYRDLKTLFCKSFDRFKFKFSQFNSEIFRFSFKFLQFNFEPFRLNVEFLQFNSVFFWFSQYNFEIFRFSFEFLQFNFELFRFNFEFFQFNFVFLCFSQFNFEFLQINFEFFSIQFQVSSVQFIIFSDQLWVFN